MNSLNSVLIEGNLTADPRHDVTNRGMSVVDFGIGVDRSYKNDGELKKEVSFVDVACFGKLADRCAEFLTKGRGVRVVGRLKQYRWTDAEGNTRSRIKVVGEHVEFKPSFPKPQEPAQESQRQETTDEDPFEADLSGINEL